jgi:hypothetical protein
MKYISNKFKIALASVLLVSQTSCSDFLKENAPSNLTPESFYTIPDHAEAALASVYADLRFMGGGAGIFSSNWQLLEALTGTSTTETAQNSDLNNLYGLVHDGNTAHVINYWNGLYKVIAQANQVIAKVPPITPMPDAQKKKILGEAKFLCGDIFSSVNCQQFNRYYPILSDEKSIYIVTVKIVQKRKDLKPDMKIQY